MAFVHLHNHTQYSLLDGACRVDKIIALAKKYDMPAVAITDHGNMFGAIDFYLAARKNGIKPIIGIETYIISGSIESDASRKDIRHHLVLLAKNLTGYKNLIKLSTKAYLKGFYYKPRIDKKILAEHSEGLICLSACLKGELPHLLYTGKEAAALEVVEFYKKTFPGRYYIEIQNHGLEEEEIVAPLLCDLAEKTSTPLVVTNDCHYLQEEDAEAHDVLLCIQTGKSLTDTNRMKYKTNQLYFKSEAEMKKLFPDIPEAYENTIKIAEEIDLQLDYDDFLLPDIEIPEKYESKREYLKQLCYDAVAQKYPVVSEEIEARIDYELSVIGDMHYEGYFLIVKDFIDAANSMSVPVGPGRGSAVGSIVSYLLGITQIDPLKYGLFFERFLNPDRIGMPDIDIDFCAEGRSKIIDYVVHKYGRKSVAQIITFGTLGAKSVIKDVARVLDLPASTANEITKLIPSIPRITLEKALKQSREFSEKMHENNINTSILKYSKVLEGLIRQIGIHAAGIVIGPGNLDEYVPLAVSTQKNSDNAVLVQYEGKWLDDLKILKMDFLGLKTLTLIKKTVDLVQESQGLELDSENFDLQDKASYELLSKGQTDGVFQFESGGMKKYLMDLKPNQFEDLIAMVALYRPGPMHPLTESTLKETYGVTVYQEQVMQIARDMGGLTGAQADTLRKAIGKKKLKTMEKMKIIFVEGAARKGVDRNITEKIWTDWLDFANYAFNKSHATAYAYVAFQTAYLKAHYPVEFMAALLSLEDNPTKIPYFMEECRKMNIEVVAPNINKSSDEFRVQGNKILFGLRAIKNVGVAAIRSIMKERDKNGLFKNIFDFCSRAESVCVNKAVLESLVSSGAMDGLEGKRSQKYAAIESALEFASSVQSEKKRGQIMLFDSFSEEQDEEEFYPELSDVHPWSYTQMLNEEKKYLGFYWSGHPLKQYESLISRLVNVSTNDAVYNIESIPNNIAIAGVVSEIIKKSDKRGNPFAIIIMEDLAGKFEVMLFSKDYDNYFEFFNEGKELFIIGKKKLNYNGNDSLLKISPRKVIAFSELKEQISGDLYLKVREEFLNQDFARNLLAAADKFPGKFSLHLAVKTRKFKMLNLHSRIIKLFPDDEVLKFFKDCLIAEPKVKINFND
jgi:DNA polymerase III subunit alpha